jgi:hypothetical protein
VDEQRENQILKGVEIAILATLALYYLFIVVSFLIIPVSVAVGLLMKLL